VGTIVEDVAGEIVETVARVEAEVGIAEETVGVGVEVEVVEIQVEATIIVRLMIWQLRTERNLAIMPQWLTMISRLFRKTLLKHRSQLINIFNLPNRSLHRSISKPSTKTMRRNSNHSSSTKDIRSIRSTTSISRDLPLDHQTEGHITKFTLARSSGNMQLGVCTTISFGGAESAYLLCKGAVYPAGVGWRYTRKVGVGQADDDVSEYWCKITTVRSAANQQKWLSLQTLTFNGGLPTVLW